MRKTNKDTLERQVWKIMEVKSEKNKKEKWGKENV